MARICGTVAALALVHFLAAATSAPLVLVFIKEQCYHPAIDIGRLRALAEHHLVGTPWALSFVPNSGMCSATGERTSLLGALQDPEVAAILGSVHPSLCSLMDALVASANKTVVSWSCPHQDLLSAASEGATAPRDSGIVRLAPPLAQIVKTVVRTVKHLRFRSAAIVIAGSDWWKILASGLALSLSAAGVDVKFRIDFGDSDVAMSDRQASQALRPLSEAAAVGEPVRVVVVAMPLPSERADLLVRAIESAQLAHLPVTALLFLHPAVLPIAEEYESPMQPSPTTTESSRNNLTAEVPRTAFLPLSPQPWWSNETLGATMVLGFLERTARLASPDALPASECSPFNCFLKQLELQHLLRKSVQILKSVNFAKTAEHILSPTSKPNIVRNNQSTVTSKSNKSEYENDAFVVDWQDGRWRSVLRFSGDSILLDSSNYLSRWKADVKHDCGSDDCEEDPHAFLWSGLANLWIALFILCGCLFVTAVAIGLTILIRRHFMRRRMFKGPCKILLSSSEFVFPKVGSDSRRVDDGMETMLCCWLQQLQEFGGPDLDHVEKKQASNLVVCGPNVGSGGAGAGTAATSGANTPGGVLNMARTLMMQPGGRMNHTPTVARYNGDVVQLKELPVADTFELRNKAMKTLLMLHDLRHENINPMLGCLLDTGRPALVLEWGTRGSLQDVLMQDDIKLDWSFRLSLLTDLVRGMRFLHATPVRVHGRLTSRNCVIDARWVLKVTDYGLPAFYELQGITPPPQTCRDLLWTAPELLRSDSLRRRGSQPGDVFSFGIIMQEVVLRGEPYCVLHLRPEEIIEKLKKPPPLIRPSVSKGAAPPEAINIMRQCWAELPSSRPDFITVNDQFKILNNGRKANFVDTMFQMLEKYSNNLEELIRQRTEQLDWEKRKTEQLLNRMLPCSVAEKLKMGQPVEPEHYEEVTIYFSDIVGFTTISSHSTAHQVVDLLNDLYTCFDATINAYNVYKVETIGDAYMVVGGLPVRISDHADQVATMALDLLHQSGRFQIGHLPNTPLRLRIGIHTGPCCAGVVGLTMPRYCLFGDTVNTASRMESTGSAWRIHISEATKDKLEEVGDYIIDFRGQTEIKGKGHMPTYWLLGKRGFNKELPQPPPIGESHGLNEKLLLVSSSTNSAETKAEEPPRPLSPRVGGAPINPTTVKAASVCSALPPSAAAATGVSQSAPSAVDRRHQQSSASSRRSSHDLTESASMDMISEAPSTGNENISNSQTGKPETVLNGIPFIGGSTMSVAGLSTPFSTSEMAVDNLGVAFLNPPSTWRSSSTNLAAHLPRTRAPDFHQGGEDLSSAYNTYRCLAPGSNQKMASMAAGRGFLKRQFSLDRGDDHQLSSGSGATPRLHKQNSAGAAAELHRIEEAPPPSQ